MSLISRGFKLTKCSVIGFGEVGGVVEAEQADFFAADAEGGIGGVEEDAGEPHGSGVLKFEGEGGADADGSGGGEDDRRAVVAADAAEGGVDAGDEGGPGFAGIIVTAFDPGADDQFVAIVPAA